MMGVREVRMFVCHHNMLVKMVMRLLTIPVGTVLMQMMRIVHMRMVVFLRFVRMDMFVSLRQMQPDTATHEASGHPECRISRFTEYRERNCRSDEWGR